MEVSSLLSLKCDNNTIQLACVNPSSSDHNVRCWPLMPSGKYNYYYNHLTAFFLEQPG